MKEVHSITFCYTFIDEKVIYSANVGDSRAVLSRNRKAIRLSLDHKPTEPLEIARIQKAGGVLTKNRVGGTLAVTRSFGDFELKTKGLICEPTINSFTVEDGDSHIIIASDGLWDVIEDQAAVELISTLPSPVEMAQKLVNHALTNGSTDNTCLLYTSPSPRDRQKSRMPSSA
eukprot:TRINITY_DN5447_c0_g1_i13.p1 TRINITY_DN5447_c0_g1~~TRINITY_DN5447_c0_g1_i13.p1  ORF type:complete len:173 (+),score=22.42 TRINITY_DN5447_c0_g1_i13:465-983(+)